LISSSAPQPAFTSSETLPDLDIDIGRGIDFYKWAVCGFALLIFGIFIALGFWRTHLDIVERQTTLATDTAAAVDSILERVETPLPKLAALVGRDCDAAHAALVSATDAVPYLRGAMLIRRGRTYCATNTALVDSPLTSWFPQSTATTPQYRLKLGTPVRPGFPLLMMFYPGATADSGVILVVEGTYFQDMLRYAQHFGMTGISLSTGHDIMGHDSTGYDRLSTDGTLTTAPAGQETARRTDIAHAMHHPLNVEMHASAELRDAIRKRELLVFVPIGLIVSVLAAVLGLTTLAPRRRLLRTVRMGLKRNEFFVHYQPLIALRTGECIGIEALLRWNHPRWGPIGPGSFIGTVEATALIVPVTRVVVARAFAEMARHGIPDHLHVAFNLAPRHLMTDQIVADIAQAMANGTVRKHPLILEITERHLIEDHAISVRTFDALKALGISLAIDDFGTENNSITQLQDFRFDFLKIDQRFVAELDRDRLDIVKGIVAMARQLNLQVIAEGVETERQATHLRELGIDYAQGFYYAHPMSAESLKNWLGTRQPAVVLH